MAPRQRIAAYDSRSGRYESVVTLTERGNYAVTIFDLDAEQTLPASKHFASESAAREYALKCVAFEDDDELPL